MRGPSLTIGRLGAVGGSAGERKGPHAALGTRPVASGDDVPVAVDRAQAGCRGARAAASYNSETGGAIPVSLLSGSQKFRVAASFALGIGQYAGQEGPRIQSVIIDEGFGSLDQKGQSDMFDGRQKLICKRIAQNRHKYIWGESNFGAPAPTESGDK